MLRVMLKQAQNTFPPLLVPDLMVAIASSPVSPIWPVGSTVTLTCIVEISQLVDVPVTVTTVWTEPAGIMTTKIAQLIIGSATTYVSTIIINSFGREQAGVYNCITTVSSTSLFLNNSTGQTFIIVRVGKAIIISIVIMVLSLLPRRFAWMGTNYYITS